MRRLLRPRASILAVAFAGALLLAPATAPACGCDPSGQFVVAHGSSPTGVPWRWKVSESRTIDQRRQALLDFSTGPPGDGGGVGSGFGLPFGKGAFVHGISSGVATEGEPSLAGFASRKALRLDSRLSDGTALPIVRVLPPPAMERKFPWLKSLVFFNTFYAYGVEPVSISAYAANGRRIAQAHLPG